MKKILASVLVLIMAGTPTLVLAHNIKEIEKIFDTILNALITPAADVGARAGSWEDIAKIKDITWHWPRNETHDNHYIWHGINIC